MFPTSLHQAIHQYHPTSRLNIWTPQSPSLDLPDLGRAHGGVEDEFKEPFDLDVLRSPGLQTLAVVYTTGRNPEDKQQLVHVDEILPFVCLSPNMKNLIIRDLNAKRKNSILNVKQEWQEFISTANPLPTACLESLTFEFPSCHGPWEEILLKVMTVVDLSRLRSLDMGVCSDPEILAQAASNLIGLERLFLHMDPWDRNQHFEDITADNEAMITAIQTFNPLKFLCLRGLRSTSSLNRILLQHGHTLEGLMIEPSDRERWITGVYDKGYKYPVLDSDQITQLAQTCPQLQELCLSLQRQQGNSHECDIYRALGQFPNLHTLILDLHCDPRRPPVGPEESVTSSCLRETLINAATDETLATGIWDLVTSNQSTRRLKNLRIIPFGADLFPREEQHVIRQVGRSFLVNHSDFSLTETSPTVKEVGTIAWKLWRENDIAEYGSIHILQRIKEIIEEFWPLGSDRNQSKKWKDFPLLVKSFPLQVNRASYIDLVYR